MALLLALAGWTSQRLYSNFAAADLVLVSSSSTRDGFEGVLENTSRTLSATDLRLVIDTSGRKPDESKTDCGSRPPFDRPSSAIPEYGDERVSCTFDVLHPGQTVLIRTTWRGPDAKATTQPRLLVSLPQQKGPKFVEKSLLHRIGKEANHVLVVLLLASLVLCFVLLGGPLRRAK